MPFHEDSIRHRLLLLWSASLSLADMIASADAKVHIGETATVGGRVVDASYQESEARSPS